MRSICMAITVVAVNEFELISRWIGIMPTIRGFALFLFQVFIIVEGISVLEVLPFGNPWDARIYFIGLGIFATAESLCHPILTYTF